jgi:hypothetical protein
VQRHEKECADVLELGPPTAVKQKRDIIQTYMSQNIIKYEMDTPDESIEDKGYLRVRSEITRGYRRGCSPKG